MDIVFPKHCAVCRKHLLYFTDLPLCNKCIATELTPKCVRNDKYNFDEAIGVLKYEGDAMLTMRRYKFNEVRYYAEAYTYFMDKATRDREYLREALICPVPLSAGRERKRSQSAVIAERLADMWQSTCIADLLYKSREVRPLSGMKLRERRFYIEDAIAKNPVYDINGKDILLIDDIYTSGTTVNECAAILKSYGARKVYVLCACYD